MRETNMEFKTGIHSDITSNPVVGPTELVTLYGKRAEWYKQNLPLNKPNPTSTMKSPSRFIVRPQRTGELPVANLFHTPPVRYAKEGAATSDSQMEKIAEKHAIRESAFRDLTMGVPLTQRGDPLDSQMKIIRKEKGKSRQGRALHQPLTQPAPSRSSAVETSDTASTESSNRPTRAPKQPLRYAL